jgi:hypothetical protein
VEEQRQAWQRLGREVLDQALAAARQAGLEAESAGTGSEEQK